MMKSVKLGSLVLFCGATWAIAAQPTLKEQVCEKVQQVNGLIAENKAIGIQTLKEEMTVMTAELFLDYADWDESNQAVNSNMFAARHTFKEKPDDWAEALPDLERRECLLILEQAEQTLMKLKNGAIKRKLIPDVDWTKVRFEGGDHLTFEGRPVFLNDFIWRAKNPRMQRFHGNLGGLYTDQNRVDASGRVDARHMKQVMNVSDSVGYVFLGNKRVPDWSEETFGPGFRMREDTYTGYDIDHPGARTLNAALFRGIVPALAGKNASALGYMLCNEPHFYTTKVKDSDDPNDWGWARGPVSDYTKAKFRKWLAGKHRDISQLNQLWGTEFENFDEVAIDIPVYEGERGSAKWQDWFTFNQLRVTDWYRWMAQEIKKHDPAARVHLKVIPNHWAGNLRGHGINLEALTALSDIMGNDHGATYKPRPWDGKKVWQDRYGFDWRAMCMGYDFMKSVSPEKMGLNSEAHYLSKYGYDFTMSKEYARAVYWLSRMLGEVSSTTWFWIRDAQGAVKNSDNPSDEYPGSINHRPAVLNEVTSTIMDLNAHAEDIMELQRLRKPIRIFSSETGAISRDGYMDDQFALYESMLFEGVPLGFVTKDILNQQPDSRWDVVLVRENERVTEDELKALEAYLKRGGTIIVDEKSLKLDEYGRPQRPLNSAQGGTLIRVSSLEEMAELAFAKVAQPPLKISETNDVGAKGCFWRWIKNERGNLVVSIINLGKSPAQLSIAPRQGDRSLKGVDLLTGTDGDLNPILQPYEVLFMELIGECQRAP